MLDTSLYCMFFIYTAQFKFKQAYVCCKIFYTVGVKKSQPWLNSRNLCHFNNFGSKMGTLIQNSSLYIDLIIFTIYYSQNLPKSLLANF